VSDALVDFALPRTDAGALVQAVVAVAVFGPALWWVREDRDLRTLVAGLGTLTFALFALRTLH
jgi:hypothetical protein